MKDIQPAGDPSRHLPRETLEQGLDALTPPRDAGRIVLIVSRREGGERLTPDRAVLTPEEGVPGDAWLRTRGDVIDAQVSLMRADVAQLFANGQPLSLFGDNLLVDLDLSAENLPPGSRLRAGRALLEVTPEPHNGCVQFRQRVGDAALRLTADPRLRHLRLRGIFARVVEPGEVSLGDPIDVIARA